MGPLSCRSRDLERVSFRTFRRRCDRRRGVGKLGGRIGKTSVSGFFTCGLVSSVHLLSWNKGDRACAWNTIAHNQLRLHLKCRTAGFLCFVTVCNAANNACAKLELLKAPRNAAMFQKLSEVIPEAAKALQRSSLEWESLFSATQGIF